MNGNEDMTRLVHAAFNPDELEQLMKHSSFSELFNTAHTIADFEQLCWIGQDLLNRQDHAVNGLIRAGEPADDLTSTTNGREETTANVSFDAVSSGPTPF